MLHVAARNHVNRMCLAANVPLVESGTAGYLGQATVIKKVLIFNFLPRLHLQYLPCLRDVKAELWNERFLFKPKIGSLYSATPTLQKKIGKEAPSRLSFGGYG